MSRLPVTHLVEAATAVRNGLQTITRRMIPPEIALLELASGFMATHALYAVAKLGLAEALGDDPLSPADIAAKAGSDPDATHRLLRACATFGVFTEHPDGRFGLTPLAETLRSSAPNSMLPVVLMLGDPRYQGPWGGLTGTIESGKPAAEAALGTTLWQHLDDDRELGAVFDAAMTRLTALDWPAVEAAYDFGGFSSVVDLGGGEGRLLALILTAVPSARGVLLERAATSGRARDLLSAAGVLDRCRVEAGSFFETVPADGDLYLLRRVIHDFADEQAAAILSNVAGQIPRGSTLLLLESVIPPGNAPHFAKALDLDVMIFVGGRERTEGQFRGLLDAAGLRLTRIIPTISTLSIIEAVPREQR